MPYLHQSARSSTISWKYSAITPSSALLHSLHPYPHTTKFRPSALASPYLLPPTTQGNQRTWDFFGAQEKTKICIHRLQPRRNTRVRMNQYSRQQNPRRTWGTQRRVLVVVKKEAILVLMVQMPIVTAFMKITALIIKMRAIMVDTILVIAPRMRSGTFTNPETMREESRKGIKRRGGSRWGTVARVLGVGRSKNHRYDSGRCILESRLWEQGLLSIVG